MNSRITAIARSDASGMTGVPAIFKSFELHEMRRQRRCDIRLALDRVDRIVFAAEDERRTADAATIRKHVERVAFAARSCEPMQHFRPADHTRCHVWIACDARTERKSQSSPGVQGGLVWVTLNLEEPPARQGADFRAAKALKQRHAPVSMRSSGSLGADEHQPAGVGWMAGGISQREPPRTIGLAMPRTSQKARTS